MNVGEYVCVYLEVGVKVWACTRLCAGHDVGSGESHG